MDELGSILREAREARGLTLVQVREQTRINERFLEALETGEYGELPTPVHVRGYLRNYARFLNLDPRPLLERYEQYYQQLLTGGKGTPKRTDADPIPPLEEQPFFNPVNVELDSSLGHEQSESTLRLVIIVALLIAIGLVVNRFLPLVTGNGDGTQVFQQALQDLFQEEDSAEDTETADVTGANMFLDESSIDATQPITSTSRNSAGDAGTPSGTTNLAVPTPTPTRPPLPATMERVQLRLDITERTWIQVRIDGEVVLQDLVTRDDGPFEWEALQEANVLTGNAIGVFVTINGIELGKMGGRGQVAEERWQATGN